MAKYLKRRWEESRGDAHDDWGASWWLFEVGDDGHALRQIVRYDTGPALTYDTRRTDDDFGALADQPLALDEDGWEPMTAAEFEALWVAASAAA